MRMAMAVSAPVRGADRAPQAVVGSDHVLEKAQGRGRTEEGPFATESDARNAPAGPELDALVARVCGWPLVVEYGVFHKGSGGEDWGYSADQAARKVLMSARTADASRLISREVADSSPSTDLPEAMRAADAADCSTAHGSWGVTPRRVIGSCGSATAACRTTGCLPNTLRPRRLRSPSPVRSLLLDCEA
jgi:hypothetical protein